MKINIQVKILFAITVVVLVILGALAFLVINSQRDLLYSAQKDLGTNIARTLDARINTREKAGNAEAIQQEIDQLKELNPNVSKVSLSIPQQNNLIIVGSSEDQLVGEQASEEDLTVFREGETVSEIFADGSKVKVIIPIYLENQRIGVAQLVLSITETQQVISAMQKRFTYGILAVIPELVIVLFLLLRFTVVNPIRELKEGAQAIEAGDFDYRIGMDRNDEIGKLADSFNRMAEEVSDFYANLDEKVKERTKALEETKDKLKKKVSELRKTKRELQNSKQELERAQESLKEKVRERTKKLRELAQKREEIIRRRTEGLRKSRKALMNILEDVEEAKREAEQERDKTAAMLNNLPEGVLFFNSERELSSINPQARKFFNLETEKITGKSVEQLEETPLNQLIEIVGKELKEVQRKELKLREGLILEATTVPMTRGEGMGTLVLLHDVTREKRVQRMKTEFVSVAAHQLRTPLSGIKWTLQMLLSEEMGDLNEEQKEFVRKTYESNERMIRLINDLLNVSRIEEGRYVYEPETTTLENIVREVLGNLQEETEEREIDLVFNKPGKAANIKVDIEKIGLAVKNLIDNAIRYSPTGGRVEVTVEKKEDSVQFSVEDNGIGIPEDQQDRIFSKFFRAENATHKETEGSGLGLFITKNIIEAHHGKIWFESESDEGTTFYFEIPNKEKFEQLQN